jgi:hypothetical protein
MRRPDYEDLHANVRLPAIGGRVEIQRTSVLLRGTVYYVDSLQVLVKWDDRSSSSLRVGRDDFRIIDGAEEGQAAE